MADLSLVFDLLARDRASQTFDKVGEHAEKAGKHTSTFGSLTSKAFGFATGALIGGGLVSTMKGLYDASAESARVGKLTNQVLKTTGGVAGITANQVGNLATALSNKTGMDDEDIQSAENLLLTFTNVRNEAGKGNDIFNQTTGIALDMSAALGTSASGAAMQLGKALNDPIKGVNALRRSGVSFTQDQIKQIKTLVASGKTMEAQKIILRETSKEFGGAAAAAATPWDRLQVSLGNLQEQIGGALIPVFGDLADGVMQVTGILFSGNVGTGPFAPNSPVVKGLLLIRTGAIMLWRFVSGTLWPGLQAVFGWLTSHGSTVRTIAIVITAVMLPAIIRWGVQSTIAAAKNVWSWAVSNTAAIRSSISTWASMARVVAGWVWMGAQAVARGAAIAAVWTAQIVRSAVAGAASFVVQVARVVGGWVLMGLQSLLQAARMAAAWFIALGPIGWVTAAVIAIVALIIANWKRVSTWTAAAWHAVWGAIQAVWVAIKSGVTAAAHWLVTWFMNWTLPGLIIGHWRQIRDFAVSIWNGIKTRVVGIATGLKDSVVNTIGGLVGFFSGLPGKIWGALKGADRWLYDTGANIIHGLINGAGSLLKNIGRFFLNMVPGWIRGPLESALGISSPSKVFAEYGRNIGQGLIGGVSSMRGAIGDTIGGLVDVPGGGLGYSPPGYDLAGAAGGVGARTVYETNVSGVASPEAVAAQVVKAQRTNEFLAGAGVP